MPDKCLKQVMMKNQTLCAHGFSARPSARVLLSKYGQDFNYCCAFLMAMDEYNWSEPEPSGIVLKDFNYFLSVFEENSKDIPIGVLLAAAIACGCEITHEKDFLYLISPPEDFTGGGLFP